VTEQTPKFNVGDIVRCIHNGALYRITELEPSTKRVCYYTELVGNPQCVSADQENDLILIKPFYPTTAREIAKLLEDRIL